MLQYNKYTREWTTTNYTIRSLFSIHTEVKFLQIKPSNHRARICG
jgi:hypothetical protein